MKKYFGMLTSCCFLLALPALSLAASGLYGSVNLGAAWLADQDWSNSTDSTYHGDGAYDTGYSFALAVGYMIDAFRVEGEIAYQKSDVDTFNNAPHPGDFDMVTYLVNGYFDIDMQNAFTPYLTAGIGAATANFSEPGFDEDDTVFAYQLGAGVGIAITEAMILDFRYRYLSMQDPEFDVFEAEVATHNLTVGLRMSF